MRTGLFKITLFSFIIQMIISSSSSKSVVLKDKPSNTSVLIGEPTILKCRIDLPENVIRIKLQWSKDMFGLENSTIQDVYKGRISIPGSVNSGIYDLHFKSTEPDDDAWYACHIEMVFKDESVESITGSGKLNIIEPPREIKYELQTSDESAGSIILQPRKSVIWALQNRKLRLRCLSKKGNPTPRLSWITKTEIETYETKITRKNRVLDVDLSSKYHNSNISCTIANKADYLGAKLPKSLVNIRVLYINDAHIGRTIGDIDQPALTGETISFTFNSVHTKEAVVQYSWFIEVNNIEKPRFERLVEKSSSNSISIKMAPKYHRGRLRGVLHSTIERPQCNSTINRNCTIQLQKEVTSSQTLNVLYPPTIKAPFENVTVKNVGEWVTLSCEVDSNPPATVRWFRTQVGTSKHSRSINWYFQTSISNLIELITIDNVITSNSYHKFQVMNEQELDIYICEAKAADYPKVYKYVIVAMEEEPTIKVERPMIKVQNDGTASLLCIVESWPKPAASNIKWHHESSYVSIVSSDRFHIINKPQLMGFESKLKFENVMDSDYGIYTCEVAHGQKIISKTIHLIAFKSKFPIYISLGSLAGFFVIIAVIVVVCVCRNNIFNKYSTTKKPPLQSMMLPSMTIDSSIDNEIYLNRLNSIPGYHKENGMNDSIMLPSNRCFVFHNQQNISKLSCGDSRNGHDEKSTTKGNESYRSWDSGVGPDDTVYRNGQHFQIARGSNCISPFSTLASSNNSIGPVNQNNINNRFWQQQYQPVELINQQNPETSSSRLSNTDNSNFNGSLHSSFIPPPSESHIPLIATSANQSFVCIPIEEYQQHMKILQESQGPPSLRSFSIASYSTNNGNSTFHPNYRAHNGNISPTDVSVKSNSTNSKV